MDSNTRKRTRSSTPTKESSPKKKNKTNKSKTKKNKRGRSNSAEGTANNNNVPTTTTTTTKPNKNSMDSTATTDGQMMAQMLSTFSKLEQSRFEAFQRVSFPVDAVGEWVAACLSQQLHLAPRRNDIRPLDDLVAVGEAGEIRTVVAVLAKLYAQRLVQTAARIANNNNNNNNNNNANNSVTGDTSNQTALQPSDIMRAYEERRLQGLDPGFFMQNAEERPAFVLESAQSFDQRRLAALEAQEEYDRQHGTTTTTGDADFKKSAEEEGS